MASIVLTAVGTALGGPIGAAVGFLAGEQISASNILGGGSRDGPRVKDLAVSTSSYGQPIARHFGAMRVAGTVIWSTDLVETRETNGGGKGKPKTTSYSYSASFAVSLGSRPIQSVGRIWADGNLLRGAAGDLKAPGTIRVYQGQSDQPVDPVIASAEGAGCPAFRACAYVVFEDLALGDFGNRIPSLTFEVFADSERSFSLAQFIDQEVGSPNSLPIPKLRGFSDEGGALRSNLHSLGTTFDLLCVDRAGTLDVAIADEDPTATPAELTALLSPSRDGEALSPCIDRKRMELHRDRVTALRYYDEHRDYQPGVQRAAGRSGEGRERVIELAGSMTADGAKELVSARSQRTQWAEETLAWRVAELDPALGPGASIRLRDFPGVWRVIGWEWSDEGVLLELERIPPRLARGPIGESGARIPPLDQPPWPTKLEAFELPWDGVSDPNGLNLFAAASAGGSNWRGATLYSDQGGALEELGRTVTQRNAIGELIADLKPSTSLLFEATAELLLNLHATDLSFSSASMDGLAAGKNRLLVGQEVLQFLHAEQVSDHTWRLSGLLRGRAATEHNALAGHATGTRCVTLDDSIVALDSASILASVEPAVAAIGFGDENPVIAPIDLSGASRAPLAPVHPRLSVDGLGTWRFCWTRRARGQWRWSDEVETPLVEEKEEYVVGYGPPSVPLRTWYSQIPQLELSNIDVTNLLTEFGSAPLWVRQVGTFGQSPTTLLSTL